MTAAKRVCVFHVLLVLVFASSGFVSAQTEIREISPPAQVTASDVPNDNGSAIDISWVLSPDDDSSGTNVLRYEIHRSKSIEGPFSFVGKVEPGIKAFTDTSQISESTENEGTAPVQPASPAAPEYEKLKRNQVYYYKVAAVDASSRKVFSQPAGPIAAKAQFYHSGKNPVMIATLVFFVLVIAFIQIARRRGASMYVRPIAGMNEIDNAIGRATEMGRPILYVMGLGAPEEIATIASYTILARVAKKTAEYRTSLLVPCNEPIVMTIAQETVKNAYLEAGHPDAYSDEMVFFITSMQFAYVAAVNGLMLREKTATNCYFGKFYAESLLLSEAGNIAGSIQVAGTDEVAQLPFFVTTCDYTLIGEELYAASAYLGRDPLLLGALKAQDYAKAAIMLLIVTGAILISLNIDWILTLVKVNM